MRQRLRSGITLIELMIAMSLMTALLALVWSLFGTYSKLEQRGSRTAVRLQLIRSLHQQLQDDLQAIVVGQPGSASLLSESPEPEAQANTLPNGVFFIGEPTRLEFLRNSDAQDRMMGTRQLVSDTSGSNASQHSQLYQNVLYEWVTDEPTVYAQDFGLGAELDAEEDRVSPEVEFPVDTTSGLTRTERRWSDSLGDSTAAYRQPSGEFVPDAQTRLESIDTFTVGASELSGAVGVNFDQPAPIAVDRVPEVVHWRFRYFDGLRWQSQWNSETTGELPMAIEVRFDLRVEPIDSETAADQELATEEFSYSDLALSYDDADDSLSDYIEIGSDTFGESPIPASEYRFVLKIDGGRVVPQDAFPFDEGGT